MTASTLPTGTVTFLFTDIEGSTRLVERLGDGYVEILDTHHRIVRDAIGSHHGLVVSTEGDSFFAVFTTAGDAVAAALAAQSQLADHDWPEGGAVAARMGIHTGEGLHGGDNYAGRDVHLGARIGAAGHGGQVLLSGVSAGAVDAAVRSLGWYRLKGIDDEVEIFEAPVPGLDLAFPPLRTADTPTNLPAQSSVFLGRDAEVDEVAALVGTQRFVTLVGPGGTGKTRLGIQVASTLLDRFPGGVYFVALDAVSEPAGIPAAILLAVGREGQTGGISTVVDEIGSSRMLLVLDNFEHLAPGAPSLKDLLAGCPNLHALVTSQVALNLRSESVHPVPPLALPTAATPEAIDASDAAQLFLAMVEQRSPGFSVGDEDAAAVAAIVRRLDGLPLAIELAAPRVRLFGLEGLLGELDEHLVDLGGGRVDAAERHRTLASAIAWSYGLLDEGQRTVMRHASVFVGGFGIDAIDAVCPSVDRGAVVGAIEALLDRNLLVAGSMAGRPRFRMLETIKAYGHEQLVENGEAEAAHRAQAEHYLTMVAGFTGQLAGPKEYAIMETLTTERANIDAAMSWSADHDPDLGLSALRVYARWFEVAGSLDDGLRVAERLLAAPGATDRARITGLFGGASIAYWLLDYVTAERWYEEALAAAKRIGDETLMGEALFFLGYSLVWQRRVDEAEAAVDRAVEIFEGLDDTKLVTVAAPITGICLWIREDFAGSADKFAAATEHAIAHDDTNEVLSGELILAAMLMRVGRIEDAVPHVVSVLGRHAELGDEAGVIRALDYSSVFLTELDTPTGLRLAGAVRKFTAHRGGTVSLAALGFPDVRELGRERLGEVEASRLLMEGEALDVHDATTLVLAWADEHGVEPAVMDVRAVAAQIAEAAPA